MSKRTVTTSQAAWNTFLGYLHTYADYGVNSPTKTLAYATIGSGSTSHDLYDVIDEENLFKPIYGKFWWEPIPDGSVYLPVRANTGNHDIDGIYADGFRNDLNYEILVDSDNELYPAVNLIIPNSFGNRNAGSVVQYAGIRFPADLIIEDANEGSNVGQTPNYPGVVINRSSLVIFKLNAICHDVEGGPVYAYQTPGSHAGSGISGGVIRQADLTAGRIPHALAINLNQTIVCDDGTGWRYPASNADSDYNTVGNAKRYIGNNPLSVMGTKFAIEPGVSAATVGITTDTGLVIFNCFKEFGCIQVDTSGWEKFYLHPLPDALDSMNAEGVDDDVMRMLPYLRLVEQWEA